MAVLTWDDSGKRLYETGVDRGVLYPLNTANGLYDTGVAWNGLTTMTESPAGADANPAYADNMKYLNLLSAETYAGTIEAFTYPDEFALCDGTAAPSPGVSLGQQPRKSFGVCYRTKVGSDLNADLGYKIHLVYGLQAAPSEKAYATVNDSPGPTAFSWAVSSTPVGVAGYSPTSLLVIDTSKVSAASVTSLTDFLYGTAGASPSLPLPDAVLAIFAAALTSITLAIPAFAANVITIPVLTGAQYYQDGVAKNSGALPALTPGQKSVISAQPKIGYRFTPPVVTQWLYTGT